METLALIAGGLLLGYQVVIKYGKNLLSSDFRKSLGLNKDCSKTATEHFRALYSDFDSAGDAEACNTLMKSIWPAVGRLIDPDKIPGTGKK